MQRTEAGALAAKSYNASDYLVADSDAVALLVLGHQTQMHNLITLTNYKTRIAPVRPADAVRQWHRGGPSGYEFPA